MGYWRSSCSEKSSLSIRPGRLDAEVTLVTLSSFTSTRLRGSRLPSLCSCKNKLFRKVNATNKCFFQKDRASRGFHVYFLGLHSGKIATKWPREKICSSPWPRLGIFWLLLQWLRSKTLYTLSGRILKLLWLQAKRLLRFLGPGDCFCLQVVVFNSTSSQWVNGLLPETLTLWDTLPP